MPTNLRREISSERKEKERKNWSKRHDPNKSNSKKINIQVTVQPAPSLPPQPPCLSSAHAPTFSGSHPAETLSPSSAGLPTRTSCENQHPISESAYCTHSLACSHIALHSSSELPCVPARRSGDKFVQSARSGVLVICGWMYCWKTSRWCRRARETGRVAPPAVERDWSCWVERSQSCSKAKREVISDG
jgi:hypothetical protein